MRLLEKIVYVRRLLCLETESLDPVQDPGGRMGFGGILSSRTDFVDRISLNTPDSLSFLQI